MNKLHVSSGAQGLQRTAIRLFQAAALALVIMLALPASAADSRAVKSRVAPAYPEIAKRMKISGVVVVEATVNAEGKVTAVKTVNGNRMLSPAAEDAVHRWTFEAGTGDATVQVELNFNL
jgi:TonB family protein